LLDGNTYFIDLKLTKSDIYNEIGYTYYNCRWTDEDRAENDKRRYWADDVLEYEKCVAMSHFLKRYNEYLNMVNPLYPTQPWHPTTYPPYIVYGDNRDNNASPNNPNVHDYIHYKPVGQDFLS
jgi:hypothetical protein